LNIRQLLRIIIDEYWCFILKGEVKMENGLSEINEIINTHLPAQVGKVLQQRLKQADELTIDLKVKQDMVDALNQTIKTQKCTIEDLQHQVAQHESRFLRDEQLNERERILDVTLANSRATNAEDQTKALFSLMNVVFRNPTVTESICKHPTSATNYETESVTKTLTTI
jgi:hypothetical protein